MPPAKGVDAHDSAAWLGVCVDVVQAHPIGQAPLHHACTNALSAVREPSIVPGSLLYMAPLKRSGT